MDINYKDLALPVSQRFTAALTEELGDVSVSTSAITLNFRDPSYSADTGGFHPVEIRLERKGDAFDIIYITDFAYIGIGPFAELVKELDFDFQSGVFQNLHGIFPIETGYDIYRIWEGNFLHYLVALNPFETIVSESD